MKEVEIRVDVTDAIDLGCPLETAATVFLPDRLDRPPAVMVAYPGSGYSRRYYDIRRLPGYSQAEHHTRHGLVLVACDPLGVGDSTKGDVIYCLTLERLAAANDATARTIVERLRTGNLADEVPPLDVQRVIGIGHSMFGGVLAIQQARHRTFDAVAILGWSAVHVSVPKPDGSRVTFPGVSRSTDPRLEARATPVGTVSQEEGVDVTYFSHGRDDDPVLVEANFGGMPRPNPDSLPADPPEWRCDPVPARTMMLAEGVVSEEAAAIDVPVMIACGEIDIVADPWEEPSAYRGSHDLTLCVVPGAGHLHNFAQTRAILWDRIASFAHCVDTRDGRPDHSGSLSAPVTEMADPVMYSPL